MDIKANKQLIMKAYQLYKANDIKSLLALFRDDIEWSAPELDYVPFSGSFHGKDQVAQFFKKLEEAQDVVRFEPKLFTAEEDRVIVSGTASWQVKASGRTYDDPWIHAFTVRDGKIASFRDYDNTAAVESAYRPTGAAGQAREAPMRH